MSSISMACHFKNISSIANLDVNNILQETDDDYRDFYETAASLRNRASQLSNESPEKTRKFKLHHWLRPIFLDPEDTETIELVVDRCQYELIEWLRTEIFNARNQISKDFLQTMIGMAENLHSGFYFLLYCVCLLFVSFFVCVCGTVYV